MDRDEARRENAERNRKHRAEADDIIERTRRYHRINRHNNGGHGHGAQPAEPSVEQQAQANAERIQRNADYLRRAVFHLVAAQKELESIEGGGAVVETRDDLLEQVYANSEGIGPLAMAIAADH